MDALIERYLTRLRIEDGLAQNTVAAYRLDLHALQLFMAAHRLQHPTELTRTVLREFFSSLTRMKLSSSSIARSMATLRGWCRFLIKEGLLKENPMMLMESPRPWARLPKILTQQEISALLEPRMGAKPEEIRDTAMLELLYATGLRVSELVNVEVAQINLGYTRIIAPADGTVGERQVRPGQLVSPGTQVMTFVENMRWVAANFRETQLTNIRVGDTAEIRLDVYPDKVIKGRVLEVAPASGSQFALLPPDNATGNFTKVVQRVPVKIAIEDSSLSSQLRPGLSAVVTVRTRH